MTEPQKEQNPTKQSETAKLDSTSAAAALALAVTDAKKTGEKPADAGPAKAGEMSQKVESPLLGRWRNQAMQAGAIAIAVGLGWIGGSHALSAGKQPPQILPEWVEAATSSLRQTQQDLVRLTGDVRVLKSIVETMKDSFDQARTEAAGQQRALIERTEGIERTAQETTAKMAHVIEASGRIERGSNDTATKLAAMSGRIDDIERQATAASAAARAAAAAQASPVPADVPPQTGSVPEPKAASKEMPVEGWVLRDVQAGVALVESRNGRLHEVVPGTKLPNVGRVEAIERRGRTWVVVTSKGIIGVPERWQ